MSWADNKSSGFKYTPKPKTPQSQPVQQQLKFAPTQKGAKEKGKEPQATPQPATTVTATTDGTQPLTLYTCGYGGTYTSCTLF